MVNNLPERMKVWLLPCSEPVGVTHRHIHLLQPLNDRERVNASVVFVSVNMGDGVLKV